MKLPPDTEIAMEKLTRYLLVPLAKSRDLHAFEVGKRAIRDIYVEQVRFFQQIEFVHNQIQRESGSVIDIFPAFIDL